jgi:hypothetical protein
MRSENISTVYFISIFSLSYWVPFTVPGRVGMCYTQIFDVPEFYYTSREQWENIDSPVSVKYFLYDSRQEAPNVFACGISTPAFPLSKQSLYIHLQRQHVFHSRILAPCSTKNLICPTLSGSKYTKNALKEALGHKYGTQAWIATIHFSPSTSSLYFMEAPYNEHETTLRTKCILEIHVTFKYSIMCLALTQL